MQLSGSNIRSRLVAGIFWLGLCAAGIWAIGRPADASASGLSIATGLLTLFVAAIVATFSLRHMRADAHRQRFFLTLSALVGAVLVFLFTNNLVALGISWCASGWLLARLIGHADGWREARAAARRAQLAFLVGDAALLAALGIIGWQTGSMRIDAVLGGAASVPSPWVDAAALLLVIAAAARCALPPFSGWLLSSMTAPTPVSALMHAGLVNAGGFLLIRLAPVLEAAPAARMAAATLGLLGAIYGIGIMMVRPDVKRALAGSTVSQMGFMIMSCGLGAYAAALWHLIAHGLFKAWLFLGAGSTIGIKAGKPMAPLSGRTSLAIAGAITGVALSLLVSGDGDANLVPLLLGLATAAATFVASIGGRLSLRAKLALIAALVALIALHGGGMTIAAMAVRPDAHPFVPAPALLALLVVFLGLWVWQQQRASSGRGLPLPLYVHLINAGALPATRHGEAK